MKEHLSESRSRSWWALDEHKAMITIGW